MRGSYLINVRSCFIAMIIVTASAVASEGEETAYTSPTISKLRQGKEQTVVCFGTSLTSHGPWVKMLNQEFEKRFPGKATVINSGGSGKTSEWGLKVLENKVIHNKPDLVFIEFSINDSNTPNNISLDKSRANLEEMITKIQTDLPTCEIILLTMTAPVKPRKPELDAYYDVYRSVAKERKLGLIDLNYHWKSLRAKDPKQYELYAPDETHANEEGCKAVVMPVLREFLWGTKE